MDGWDGWGWVWVLGRGLKSLRGDRFVCGDFGARWGDG